MSTCKSIGCINPALPQEDFCLLCSKHPAKQASRETAQADALPLAQRYPQYYKDVAHLQEIDVYGVHQLFNIQDPSGAIQHASKKLLLSGVRTGGKSVYDDIREARDTLSRWLDLHSHLKPGP